MTTGLERAANSRLELSEIEFKIVEVDVYHMLCDISQMCRYNVGCYYSLVRVTLRSSSIASILDEKLQFL